MFLTILIPLYPVYKSSEEEKNQNTEKVVDTVFLTLGQEYCYESEEDTMPLNLKIILQTFMLSKMKASVNFIETESSDLEGTYSSQIIFLKMKPGQSNKQYEVDNCKINSENTLGCLIPFHQTLQRLKSI